MNSRLFVITFSVLILFSWNNQVYGEDGKIDISEYLQYEDFTSGVGEIRETDKLIFEIGKDSTVRVKHVIIGDIWSPSEPKLIKMLPGKHSNLQVTDEDGDYLRPMGFVGETFEESEYIIAGQKPYRAYDLVAEYDLENFLELNQYGMWEKHFVFPHDVEIFIDDEIDLVFVNSRPIDISEAGGINCRGCDMKLEFFDQPKSVERVIIKSENKFEELSNTGKEFVVDVLSDDDIDEIKFIDELNYFSFEVNRENQLYVLTIPLDLILSPYHVFLTEPGQEILMDSDQIRKTEFNQTETHAKLSFVANSEGLIHVVGSNEMEHQMLLEQLEKKKPQEKVTPEKTEPEQSKEDNLDEVQTQQLYENWGQSNTSENDGNLILILIIIAVAIGIGIAVAIKKKKN